MLNSVKQNLLLSFPYLFGFLIFVVFALGEPIKYCVLHEDKKLEIIGNPGNLVGSVGLYS